MQQLTLQIQDYKYPFFLELIRNFDFINITDDISIPEEHKKIVLDRIKSHEENPDLLLDWESVKNQI
jgi:hypothetical protein